jgi:hypothetical protein
MDADLVIAQITESGNISCTFEDAIPDPSRMHQFQALLCISLSSPYLFWLQILISNWVSD